MLRMIAAMDRAGGIGREGGLPWDYREDLRRFAMLTEGSTVVMGRKTYDSLSRPLRRRSEWVLTRQRDWEPRPDHPARVIFDPGYVRDCADDGMDLWVIGGADIYKEFLPDAKRLYLTVIPSHYGGDRFFPAVNIAEWRQIEYLWVPEGPGYAFITYERL